MRDPYDVLGIRRGATFDEVKAAYRRACKTKHPDMGGSQQDFVELQTAYEAALNDLKRGFQTKREDGAPPNPAEQARDDQRWQRAYRDIDEELEELRRATRQREDALHAMRAQAWEEGNRVVWARLTWQDIARFFTGIVRSGLKGIALLCTALLGVGSVLLEANAVSAIIMLGAGIGFVFSQALKSDKGGMLSAGLLLFGIMTIWLPSVRQALVHYPLATISLLFCLALIFKFGEQGGMVGLMTGGLLTLYVATVIFARTPQLVSANQPAEAPVDETRPADTTSQPVPREPTARLTKAEIPKAEPEIRELIASKGAILKLVSGITYRLKIRAGSETSIVALQGSFAAYRGDEQIGECTDRVDLAAPPSVTPYSLLETSYQACGAAALLRVIAIR